LVDVGFLTNRTAPDFGVVWALNSSRGDLTDGNLVFNDYAVRGLRTLDQNPFGLVNIATYQQPIDL